MSGAAAGSPMKRIPFAMSSYQHPSAALSSKRLLNFFVEQEPADARVAAAIIPTAGLTYYDTFGIGPVRAMNSDEPGRVYIASGDRFYRLRFELSGRTVDDMGSIGTGATDVLPGNALMVTIAVGPTAVVVCVPPNAFTCDHFGVLNQIGGAFPGAATVAYLDGYFVFTAYANDAQFFVSRLLDPSAFDALDFAFSDALPNVIRRAIAHKGDIWLLGGSGIEIWYDSGDADFPFRRQSGGVIPVGVGSPQTVAQADGSVFWIGVDSIVYRSHGYQAVRISDHAIEATIQHAAIPDAGYIALTHIENGHVFYSVTLGERTISYDCATQQWADRSSGTDGSTRWRANTVAQFSGLYYVGDYTNGRVYSLDTRIGTDNGVAVMRQAVLPPLWAGTARGFCARLEVEMETGAAAPPGDLLLEWSDDGGTTWTGSRALQTGAAGQTRKRVFTTRLGSFRQRVFRLTCNGRATLYAVDADITAGAS